MESCIQISLSDQTSRNDLTTQGVAGAIPTGQNL